MKPIGRKNYGSIPHLHNSKLGKGDYYIGEGQDIFNSYYDKYLTIIEKCKE